MNTPMDLKFLDNEKIKFIKTFILKKLKIDEVLGEYNEKTNSITAKYYLYRFTDQLTIAIRYRHYVSKLQFIKIIKIILSKQWVIGLLRKKSHGY